MRAETKFYGLADRWGLTKGERTVGGMTRLAIVEALLQYVSPRSHVHLVCAEPGFVGLWILSWHDA